MFASGASLEAGRAAVPRMCERGGQSWFYAGETRARSEKAARSAWLSEVRESYREQLLTQGLDVSRVLPCLVYDGVFSLKECREVLAQDCEATRAELFLLMLFSKGPHAFCAFCSHLEELCPYLLTCFFLYYQGKHGRELVVVRSAGMPGEGVGAVPPSHANIK